jgi:hypothetical protein
MFGNILTRYSIDEKNSTITPFGNGLINHTWKIKNAGNEWLLQRVNHQIFRRPGDIMDNCRNLSEYLKTNHPDYLFVAPMLTKNGQNFVVEEDDYYRIFPFIENSYSCDTVSLPALAYEAAKQFGKFTRLLSTFDPSQLHITLPDFHNLALRYQQFESARINGNLQRIGQSAEAIRYLKDQRGIVEVFEKIKHISSFKTRVIHHDAKINNVLFDQRNDTGLCVIDLDTVMPGYYISDVGDMLRTYLCPVSEEEQDFSRIGVRVEYFRAVVKGYLGEMQAELSEEEKQYFVYAGKFAIYMQALRFLTDYINNDIYYSIKYESQNLVRANNQIVLLKLFIGKEKELTAIANEWI